MIYDIAIIGLGPAGSTLARLLNGEFKTIAIDKKTFGGDGFQKPCGGLLSSDAQKALAGFDMTLPKDVMVDPQIFAVKTIDLKNNLIRPLSALLFELRPSKIRFMARIDYSRGCRAAL